MTKFSSPVPRGCRFTSGFKTRLRPTHAGCDYAPPVVNQKEKVTIYAAADGTVTGAGTNVLKGHTGKIVIIDHGYLKDRWGNDRMITNYGHCERLLVSAGDKVKAGQPIAIMGSTGNSTNTHLHFGVRCNGVYIDSRAWLLRKGIDIGKTTPLEIAAVHTVKSGDTLGAIALKYKTTVAKLVKLNSIKDKNVISIGQKIKVK